MSIPHLERRGGKTVLIVHNLPLILLAGEVHNSSSSSLSYMEGVWDKAEELGMNALLLPAAWETVEPQEGAFDFALVAGLIGQAGERGKTLVLLWFGRWKIAECMHAPAWVKTDLKRSRRGEALFIPECDTPDFGAFRVQAAFDHPMLVKKDGVWRTLRRLNGDEAAFMPYDTPALLRVKVLSMIRGKGP